MVKVMVIGNAGGGKSTLSKALALRLDLPHFELDQVQWQPNWVPTPDADIQAWHQDVLARERWILDGYGSQSLIEARLVACDTIVLLDLPIAVHFWWATKRQIKSLFVGRPDGPEGCAMWPVTLRLIKMMWWLHREMRPALVDAVYRHADRRRIIHIRSPRQLNRFLQNPV